MRLRKYEMEKSSFLINKNFYPEYYIPQKLLNIFEGNFIELIEKNRPKLTEQEPILPKPPEEPDLSEIFILLPAFIGLLFNLYIFLFLISILFGIFLFRYISNRILHPKSMKIYALELSSYQASMSIYLEKVEYIKKQSEKYNSDLTSYNFINSLIIKELNEIFKSSPESSVCVESPKKGRSENFFKKYLVQYFEDAINDDCTIEIFQYTKRIDYDLEYFEYDDKYIDIANCYVPDFCFIHPTKSLKIDIEIDEPYTYSKPIHYFGSDNSRNKYFTDKNWIVLRFSEQQVQKAPNECCREIAELIFDLTNDRSYINKLLNFERLTRMKKWTLDDVTNQINRKYRQNYSDLEKNIINKDFINGLWENEEISYKFEGSFVEKVTKQKHFIEKAWKKQSGIFYLIKDKLNRYCINILWGVNHTECLIIDNLSADSFTTTNMHTRAICSMTFTHSIENVSDIIFHDSNFKISYSIEGIKQILRYEQLPFRRIYMGEQKTEYLYFFDKERRIVLTMHQNLVNKLNGEKTYNKIKLSKPGFSKFNQFNVVKFDLIDEVVIS